MASMSKNELDIYKEDIVKFCENILNVPLLTWQEKYLDQLSKGEQWTMLNAKQLIV